MEANKEDDKRFAEANNKFDKHKIYMKRKIFMKISDVDIEDAENFKNWCDRHVEGRQFQGIKLMMMLVDKLDPIVESCIKHINLLDEKVDSLAMIIAEMRNSGVEEKKGPVIPQAMGRNLK